MARTFTVVLAGTLLVTAESASAQDGRSRPCQAALPGCVRVMDCRLAPPLADGLARSATLRRLVDRIEGLAGLVYVTTAIEIRDRNNRRMRGRTWNVVSGAGPRRIARVQVEERYDDDGVGVLAHELQHVVEMLESNGTERRNEIAPGILETRAAQQVQRAVLRELRASRAGQTLPR